MKTQIRSLRNRNPRACQSAHFVKRLSSWLALATTLTVIPAHATPLSSGGPGDSTTVAAGSIAGPDLTVTGSGNIRLTGAGTYVGTTTIAGGLLSISNPLALGLDPSQIVVTGSSTRGFGGGSLYLDGSAAAVAISRDIFLQGFGPISDRSAALFSSGENTLSGVVTMAAPVGGANIAARLQSVDGTLTLSGALNVNGTAAQVSGNAAGTVSQLGGAANVASPGFINLTGKLAGAGILEKIGTGTLFLNPSNSGGFTGQIRVGSSAAAGQSEVRLTSPNVLGIRNTTTNGIASVLDLNGGILSVLSDAPSVTSGGAPANVYNRGNSAYFFNHADCSSVINQTVAFGNLSFNGNTTATFNSRNGYGASFASAPVVAGANNNNTITNNMGGLLSFSGNVWGNTDNGASRTFTINGNGNTLISGVINGSSASFDHNLNKAGTGLLTIAGTGSTLDGNVNIQDGGVRITDFSSLDNNTSAINIGNGGTSGRLLVGGTGVAPTAPGLTTSKLINLAGSTGSAFIHANQTGTDPVVLNSVTSLGVGAKSIVLAGTNTADNIITDVITNAAGGGFTGTATASGVSVIPLASTAGIVVGQLVTGTGIPFGASVTAITPGVDITISAPTNAARTTEAVNVESLGAAITIQKRGPGTWVLAGAPTAALAATTGTVIISEGTLKIRANDSGGGVSNILSAANAVTFLDASGFAGGTLQLDGLAGTNSTQALGALTVTQGANTVRMNPGAGGTASVSFSSIAIPTLNAVQATVNFVAPTALDTVTIAGATVGDILRPSAYYNGADFAFVGAGNVLRAPIYGDGVGGAGSDVDFVTTAAGPLTAGLNNEITGSVAAQPAVAIDTLKINGSQTLAMAGILTVQNGGVASASGGILQTGGAGSITGTGVTTAGGGSLVIRVNGGGDSLTLAAPILATTSGGFTKSGAGTLILSAANNQSGANSINEGTVQLSGVGRVAASNGGITIRQGATLDLNGVTPTTQTGGWNNNGTLTNSSATAVIFTVGGNNQGGTSWGTVNQTAGTINIIKTGNAAQTWIGNSNYTGTTTIGGNTAGLVNVDVLANGGVNSGIGASTNAAANLVFNGTGGGLVYSGALRDGDQTFGSVSASTDRLFTISGSSATLGSTATNNNAIVWSNTGAVAFTGAGTRNLTFAGDSSGSNTFLPLLGNNGTSATSVTKVGTGVWVLGDCCQQNTYTGATTLSQGILVSTLGFGLPTASNLVFDGGALQTTGSLNRNLGTAAGEMRFAAAPANTASFAGGFMAGDSKLTVTIGGAAPTWGVTANFLSDRDGLFLNGSQARGNIGASAAIANAEVELASDFSLGTVAVAAASGLTYTVAQNSAQVTGLTSTAGLKVGQSFTGTNIPAGAYIVSISNATTIQLSANTANVGGTAGSFTNGVGLAITTRAIRVDDNGNSGTDFATISGDISGVAGTGIRKLGGGVLSLTGANTYSGLTEVNQGTLIVNSLGSSTGPVTGTSVGTSTGANLATNAITLGNGSGGAAILVYSGTGEVSDRKIQLNTTTGSNQIHADGTGPLELTNLTNDLSVPGTVATTTRTLFLRGSNTQANIVSSALADFENILGVTVDGGATWVLNNATNSYTGTTTVNAGALGIGSNTALGTGTLSFGSGSTFASGGDRSVANATTLQNNNTTAFIGTNSLDFTGVLALGQAANDATITNNIVAGKTLTFSNASITANALTGTRTLTVNGSGYTILAGSVTTTTTNALALSYTGTGTLELRGNNTAVTGNTNVSNSGTLVLDYGTNNTSKIGNNGTLTLNQGNVVLAGGSHLEQVASTTVSAGNVNTITRASGTSVLALAAINPGVLTNASTRLEIGGEGIASTTTANGVGGIPGILGLYATVTNGTGGTDWAANSGVSDGSAGSLINAYTGYSDVAAGGPLTAAGNDRIVAGSGAAIASGATAIETLKANSSATLTMSGALQIGNQSAQGGGVLLDSGVSLVITGSTVSTGGAPDGTADNLRLITEGTSNLTINSNIVNNGTGLVALSKQGAGTVILGGANTYTGGAIVNQGILQSGAANVHPTGTITVNATAAGLARLDLNGFNDTIGALTLGGGGGLVGSDNQVTTGTGTLTLGGTVTVNSNGNWTTAPKITGNLSLGGATRTFAINDSLGSDVDLDVQALISQTGTTAVGITKTGVGTLLLSNANTYTGTTTVNNGAVRYGVNNALFGGAVVINANGVNQIATLDLDGFSGTIASLTFGAGGQTATSSGIVSTGTGTLTLGGNVTTVNTGNPGLAPLISGNLSLGAATRTFTVADSTGATSDLDVDAVISGAVGSGLTKAGLGTMTVSGVNTYDGATTVSAGELHVAIGGSLAATSAVTVAASSTLRVNGAVNLAAPITVTGTLAGKGTVGDVTTVLGGNVAPGNGAGDSTGTLSTGNFNLVSGSTLTLQISTAPDYDVLNVTGGITLAGDINVSLLLTAECPVKQGDMFLVVLNDGVDAALGGFANAPITGSTFFGTDGSAWSIDYAAGDGNDVKLMLIPEPSSLAMLAASLGMTVGLQRFRRRRQS